MNPPWFPPIQQKTSGRFSLILAGGLARGAARLGAWRALAEASFVPNWAVGVSTGAIIGTRLCKEGGTAEALAGLRDLARTMHGDLCANGGSFWDACGD